MERRISFIILVLLFFCCVPSFGIVVKGKNIFLVAVEGGLHINTTKNKSEILSPFQNFSMQFSCLKQNRNSLGASISIAINSNSNKYHITQKSFIEDNKIKARIAFGISLKQLDEIKIYTGLFSNIILYQSTTFTSHGDNAASYLNLDISKAENFFNNESQKVNAGFYFSVYSFPFAKSGKNIFLEFNLFQNLIKEYHSNFEIANTFPNIQNISSSINPLLTEINIGIGLKL